MEIRDLDNCPMSLELEFQAAVTRIIAGSWWDTVVSESDVSQPELTMSGLSTLNTPLPHNTPINFQPKL